MSLTSAPEVRGCIFKAAVVRLFFVVQWAACAMLMASGAVLSEPLRQLEPPALQARPSFTLDSLDGASVDLAALRGQPVLVHFFATWCEPCKAEFGALAQLAAQRPALKILAIDVGEVPSRVRRFVEAERISLPILLDPDRKVTKAWGVSLLPTSFVLDAEHAAKLMVEGDLDWSRPDIVAAIDAVAPTITSATTTQQSSRGENK